MKAAALLPAFLLLAGCDQQAAATHRDKPSGTAGGNTMSCVTGDLKLSGSGEPEVGVGGFGIRGNTLDSFALSLHIEHAGKVHQVTSSLMPLPMQTGTYHIPSLTTPGATFAFYKVRSTSGELLREYSGGIYGQQFSPIDNDPEAKLKVQIHKMDVTDAQQPGFKRVHAAGHFSFNAAALPGSSPSDACVSNGIARSLASVKAGKRVLPLYDATVCGAQKMHIQCDFDIVTDFVKQQ